MTYDLCITWLTVGFYGESGALGVSWKISPGLSKSSVANLMVYLPF